jgi:hypothetical protein
VAHGQHGLVLLDAVQRDRGLAEVAAGNTVAHTDDLPHEQKRRAAPAIAIDAAAVLDRGAVYSVTATVALSRVSYASWRASKYSHVLWMAHALLEVAPEILQDEMGAYTVLGGVHCSIGSGSTRSIWDCSGMTIQSVQRAAQWPLRRMELSWALR